MNTVGTSVYNETDKIGEGAFGTVYKGQRPKKNPQQSEEKKETVAIKVVDLEDFNVKKSPDTIHRETEILTTLSSASATHRNIVSLLFYEKVTHYVYFVMEFCNGGNLQEYLKSKQKLNESTIKGFLRQMTAGLKVAHDTHIIHRDLKPENLLLCFSGPKYPSSENIILKIADFGVGRFLSDDEMAKTVIGSLPYMAPEVLVGRRYGFKADLWSVGVIAYECFVGKLPNDLRIPMNGAEIPTNVSADFRDVLKGLLERDETKRFNMKQVFNHQFLADTISISVLTEAQQTQPIRIMDNQSVDQLLDMISTKYNKSSEVLYLIHGDNELKRGSNNSLREAGVAHHNNVILVIRADGGDDKSETVTPDGSVTVSNQRRFLSPLVATFEELHKNRNFMCIS